MITWQQAMRRALYGPDGFFSRHAPADHFRTSAVSPRFAAAIARLATLVAERLGTTDRLDVVDVGAGRGELLLGIAGSLPAELRRRARFTAVELAPRPAGLPDWIDWRTEPARPVTGLLLATEWLDNVPVDVVERDEAGQWRQVLVDPATGAERLGTSPAVADRRWLRRWVPDHVVRAEPGGPRDRAWAEAVASIDRGLALAVDYGHRAGDRPAHGTLTGYRYGRQVPPVPDGSCDLTAHVAIDSVAVAGQRSASQRVTGQRVTGQRVTGQRAAGQVRPEVLDQSSALRALGGSAPRPPRELATTDPAGYVRALAAASHAAELTDTAGLGAHFWLLQPVALPFPRLSDDPSVG